MLELILDTSKTSEHLGMGECISINGYIEGIEKFIKYRLVLWSLFGLIIFSIFILAASLTHGVLGAVFDDYWYLGHSPTASEGESSGNTHIIYSYPDVVHAGKPFKVGVTLEYVKDKQARSEWLTISNVSVTLKNYSNPYGNGVNTSEDKDIKLIRLGEQYSHSFTLSAPAAPGKYLVFLRWIAFLGPGGGVLQINDWDMNSYYNHTERKFGVISPEELPPVIVNKNDNRKERILEIGIQEPYNKMPSSYLTIAKQRYHTTAKEISLKLLVNTSYVVTAPQTIDMVHGKIRAAFSKWSDGNPSNTRNVTLDNGADLFALYKIQYYLSVNSNMEGDNTQGTDWYDGESQAVFSANPFIGLFSLHSFNHWIGDIAAGQNTVTSGSLIMDGPKEITALYRLDYGFLGAIGTITGIVSLLAGFRNSPPVKRFLEMIKPIWIWGR